MSSALAVPKRRCSHGNFTSCHEEDIPSSLNTTSPVLITIATTSTDSYTVLASSSATTTTFPTTTSGPSALASSTYITTIVSNSSTNATTSPAASGSSSSNAGIIAGSVIGGVVFLALLALGGLTYLRIRKRRRTPPSSEFINSLRAGVTPVLRLDSGAEYTPALPEKGGGYSHYTSLPMYNMKSPDDMMMEDIPSAQPNVEKPLQPRRFSAQPNDSLGAQHRASTSVGSRRGLWETETEDESLVRQPSPTGRDSALHFAPRFSLDERHGVSPQPSYHSPTSLHPLRRQPESEDIIE